MRAVVLRAHGGPEVLQIEEVPDPEVGADDVLVDIRSTSLNRADLLQRLGYYASPRPEALEIPGLEFAGTVAAVGRRVTLWHPGDAVMGIDAGGGHAERIAVHERQLMAVPASVPLADAGAIPEVYITAWDALVLQGRLASGRWALVHAGASGVGTAAIQIAKAVGARVAVTCSAGKMAACRDLGADVVLERSPADWASAARSAVPGGFDTVLDVVGGDEISRNLGVTATNATIVQVGLLGGAKVAVDVGAMLARRVTWIGTTLRARPLEEKIAVTRRFAAEMLPRFDDGALRPLIDSRFALDDVASAHERMARNENVGKIVIDVSGR